MGESESNFIIDHSMIQDVDSNSCSSACKKGKRTKNQREKWHKRPVCHNWTWQGEVPDVGGGENTADRGLDGAVRTVSEQ